VSIVLTDPFFWDDRPLFLGVLESVQKRRAKPGAAMLRPVEIRSPLAEASCERESIGLRRRNPKLELTNLYLRTTEFSDLRRARSGALREAIKNDGQMKVGLLC
jgi:hypothetical protein